MLSVQNLSLELQNETILDRVSFDLAAGQTLCIVGESGSGKTSLLKSLQGLHPAQFKTFTFSPAGTPEIRFQGRWQSAPGLPSSRWVMQDPLAALNPRLKLGQSIGESLHREKLPRKQLETAVRDVLLEVELPPEFAERLPAEVSMGQAQRACLARALIARPKLVFFDEPLSALDAVVQKQIAATMRKLQLKYGMAFAIVTHDLGFASAYADQVLVLRKGKVDAYEQAGRIFDRPPTPYCRDLLEAARTLGALSSQNTESFSSEGEPA